MKDAAGKELKAATKLVGGLGLTTSKEKKPFIQTKVDPKQGVNKAAAWAQDCQKLAELEHVAQFHKIDGNFRSAYSEIRRIGSNQSCFRDQIKTWRNSIGSYKWAKVGTINSGVRTQTSMEVKFRLRNNILRVLFRFTPMNTITLSRAVNPKYIGQFACMYDTTGAPENINPDEVYCRNIRQRFPELALYATIALDQCGLIQH